jgi:UDP-N-acetylmuramoyl-L-alanyl-D-glutamate--2,6-diaminopimelate ligase
MEVSSIAVDQHRIDEIQFEVGVFTNLTQDHLDYHGTMEKYFEAKAGLFARMAEQGRGRAVLNIDDGYGQRLADRFSKLMPITTFGSSPGADVRASDSRSEFTGTTFRLDAEGKSFLVRMPMIGRYNISNATAALATASALGLNLREAVKSLEHCEGAPGRLQAVPAKRLFKVFIDYAHTPDALLNVLRTLRELDPRRLVCVFGCGGDRDKGKRALMGQIAGEHADHSILTSDNPRRELPSEIIGEIARGFRHQNFEVIEDRREAIFKAVSEAGRREIILIAGKGHETYQEFASHTLPFDDFQVAKWAIESKAAAQAALAEEEMLG